MRSRMGWSMRSRAWSHAPSEENFSMTFSTPGEFAYAEQWKQHWNFRGAMSIEENVFLLKKNPEKNRLIIWLR